MACVKQKSGRPKPSLWNQTFSPNGSSQDDYEYTYILRSSARFARAEAYELYYRIRLQDYITDLYYGIILRDNITELVYRIILRDYITDLYHAIVLWDTIMEL